MAMQYGNRTYANGQPVTTPPTGGGTTQGGYHSSQGTVGTTGALPQGFSGQQGTAYTRTAQPGELVSSQLQGLLARDNPYIRQQEDAGYRRANSRGLLDSSIGLQAGRAAAIESAVPIAAGDAAAMQAAAGQNMDALNQMARQQEGDATSRYNADQGLAASTYGANIGLTNNREQRAFSGEQQGLDRTFQDYMQRQGFTEQQIQDFTRQGYNQQNMALTGGLNMMQQGQQFRYNAALQGMDNPYIMQNQEAFGGFMNWAGGDGVQYMRDLLDFALGGN